MGTNYYLTRSPCQACGRGGEERHIGKSSAGWCFALHVEPDDPSHPQNLEDWLRLFCRPEMRIVDEYGGKVTVTRMLQTIVGRKWQGDEERSEDWYEQNHAKPGPHGLLRRRHATPAPNDGTWDLVSGEFS